MKNRKKSDNPYSNFIAPFAFIFVYLLGVCLMAFIVAWPAQWLWNTCLVPSLKDGVLMNYQNDCFGIFI